MKPYIFFLFFLPFLLFPKSIILNITSKFNVPSDFKGVIENNLEDYKYRLIDMVDSDSLDIEVKKSKVNCRKDSCYIELGKKFNADYLLDIYIDRILDHYTSKYKVKLIIIDLKSLDKIKKLFYYKYRLSNIDKLRVFTESMMIKFFDAMDKIKKLKKIERLNKIPKKLTKKNILTMIREVYPSIKECGRNNDYSGIIKIKFKINNDGSVSNITFITEVTDIIKECIYNSAIKMRTIKFRAKPIIVNFPLKLD